MHIFTQLDKLQALLNKFKYLKAKDKVTASSATCIGPSLDTSPDVLIVMEPLPTSPSTANLT